MQRLTLSQADFSELLSTAYWHVRDMGVILDGLTEDEINGVVPDVMPYVADHTRLRLHWVEIALGVLTGVQTDPQVLAHALVMLDDERAKLTS